MSGLFKHPATPVSLLILLPNLLFAADNTEDKELNELLQGFNTTPTENQQTEPGEKSINHQDNIDELLSGFEEEPASIQETSLATIEKKWDVTTLLSLSSSYNYQKKAPLPGKTDFQGLSRLKLKFQPEFRYKVSSKWSALVSGSAFYDAIYRLKNRSNYTKTVLDSNESELELREAYVNGIINRNFDIKLGRQIVVWGKSDSIRVVDVLNPLDFREPGIVDIEDLRLPVTMLKADYYFSNWNISVIVIPEIRFNKMPVFGSDFGLSNSPPLQEKSPDNWTNPEFALAMNGVFSGWDLSFHGAHYYNDQAHVIHKSNSPNYLKHSQLNMLGVATNFAIHNWLLKLEAAYIDGFEFSNLNQDFSRIDSMVGFDYAGITNTTLSVEMVNRHINKYVDDLASAPDMKKENEGQIALRYTGSFMREKLKLVALASFLGLNSDSGAFYRASMEYELKDAFTIMLGGIIYQSGDSFLINQIADNDRIFFDIRYSF